MIHTEEILKAIATIMNENDSLIFSRKEIRIKIGLSHDEWMSGYTSIFQGMRIDQAGGAPDVGQKFKNVFCQVKHGVHSLTDYGRQLIKEYDPLI